MPSIPFLKMHGCGNDFVVLDQAHAPEALEDWTRLACDRRRGIGSDGLLVLSMASSGELVMEMLNPDGSHGGMCGNGIRCSVLAARLWGWSDGPVLVRAGARLTAVEPLPDGLFRVQMGRPDFSPQGAGVDSPEPWLGLPLPDFGIPAWMVGMGNPHCVVFNLNRSLAEAGPLLEVHPLFPHRANIQSVVVESRLRLRVRTWERGAGLTLACGSGACASFAAARLRGLVEPRAEVALPGGSLWLEDSPEGLAMTGPAVLVYSGSWTSSSS